MQRYVRVPSQDVNSEEGLWIDLLEWCASQSAGPMTGCTSRTYKQNWGIHRKRKKLGWSGEMKERLVYSVLERLIQQVQEHEKLRPDFIQASTSINPSQLIPKLFFQHYDFIEFYLDQFDWNEKLKHQSLQTSTFLSLKLLKRIQTGFQVCGNRRGIKIINRLISWRYGK
ncbi:uncharacterized protein MELLADRAFT_73114 [Melampsora larici-populina 98AG31]|uniref:Uncharacterized protein n=1 Tax=Melampsora larici-populina (strain 98AG31 / pathotype 3-4-7) TaxID=747676 RepID=F4S3C2_MELLP|nr:uncharacterized protein MELLADRAFT_73114 [Melampsora larici-populina 98AG31]EGG00865.1 hypothetical protein MELLADRAFT_73114 [Melampsora larici-populina 98AG31]